MNDRHAVFLSELKVAVQGMRQDELQSWSMGIIRNLGVNSCRRAENFYELSKAIIVNTSREAVLFAKHAARRELNSYIKDRALKTAEIAKSVGAKAKAITNALRSNPSQGALQLATFALGFQAGSGGLDGDGGIPDLDLVIGDIGDHRSIVTHSVAIGILIDTVILSLIELIEMAYVHLPEKHSLIWDKSALQAGHVLAGFSAGTSLGLAYHFFVDSMIDTGKAYADLPFSMPMEAHQLVQFANASIELADGKEKTGNLAINRTDLDSCIAYIHKRQDGSASPYRQYCEKEASLNILRNLWRIRKDVFLADHIGRLREASYEAGQIRERLLQKAH
ncbi:MAG TPA: hypothetical protein PKB11_04895 [Desulfovibrio sp.]|uniref:hypothetical protein n=1 Tax=Desulfovibrio sp. TaxID=885 RepID=UPI002C80399D|nr:hypothetical protein [Desulfovibrio sp.]HMM38075.1 hypothetical protein [Desulfovibrio sp.]